MSQGVRTMPVKVHSLLAALVFAFLNPLVCQVADKALEPIRIGSILIPSGEGSSWGIASRNGIEMALR